MKKIFLFLFLLPAISYAAQFNGKGNFSCRTTFGRYDETEKFTVYNMKENGKRDASFHTLDQYATDACFDYGSELIECAYGGYSIFIDLTYMRPVSDLNGALIGFEVDGTIDTFWRSRASIVCEQPINKIYASAL